MAGLSETSRAGRVAAKWPVRGLLLALPAASLLGASWALIWTLDTPWNPFFFTCMWLGATLLMYALGADGHPGWRQHTRLIGLSIPLWWWFELVNSRVGNWEYVATHDYVWVQEVALKSLAFSTVAPALHAACRLTAGWLRVESRGPPSKWRKVYLAEGLAGCATLVMVFAIPDVFFPFVWIAPFLVLDAVVGHTGGRSIVGELAGGRWRLAVAVGLAGLLCGILWELWNYWATPKWVYHIPHFDLLRVFEMPLLGYGGYVPFAWSVYQILALGPQLKKVRGLIPGRISTHRYM